MDTWRLPVNPELPLRGTRVRASLWGHVPSPRGESPPTVAPLSGLSTPSPAVSTEPLQGSPAAERGSPLEGWL